jgi:hypothetical protein
MTKSFSSQKEIRAIIGKACAAKELLIIITQYLKFESSFVLLDGDEVHAKTTAGGEDALRILGVSDLDLRFPNGFDFMGATTRMIGLGETEGMRTVRFALPTVLRIDDSRGAPRTSLTEGLFATFSLRGKRLVRADIANISISGARLTMAEDLPSSELRVRDNLMLTVRMPGDITIINGAIIRHADYRNFGVEFVPPLAGKELAELSKWVFLRHEEEREMVAKREDLSLRAALSQGGGKTEAEGGAILLATNDDAMKTSLRGLLGEDRKFLSVPLAPAHFGHAISQSPILVILHASGDADAQPLKALVADIPHETPVLLLGTGMEAGPLSELGAECRAAASMLMAPNKGPFLQRLVLGILRKYYGHGESPMVQ